MVPSECDVLILGPQDAVRRTLAGLLLARGYSVLATAVPADARNATARALPKAIIMYLPPGFRGEALTSILDLPPLDEVPLLRVDGSRPEAAEDIVADIERICPPPLLI